MTRCGDWPIGVCSWSLQQNIQEVVHILDDMQIDHVHLAIRPAIEDNGHRYVDTVKNSGLTVCSTMIDFPQEDYTTPQTIKKTGGVAPDDSWEYNLDLFKKAVDITAELKVPFLSAHAGFIDLEDAVLARKFFDRIRCLADIAASKAIMLLMETGQESAEELKHFLEQLHHPALGVNFDPANMILYDKGDPIQAVKTLAPWIRHIHAKDAIRTTQPGTWGLEVPWGDGQVGVEIFLGTLKEIGYKGALAIEREMGDQRVKDIQSAVERLAAFSG